MAFQKATGFIGRMMMRAGQRMTRSDGSVNGPGGYGGYGSGGYGGSEGGGQAGCGPGGGLVGTVKLAGIVVGTIAAWETLRTASTGGYSGPIFNEDGGILNIGVNIKVGDVNIGNSGQNGSRTTGS